MAESKEWAASRHCNQASPLAMAVNVRWEARGGVVSSGVCVVARPLVGWLVWAISGCLGEVGVGRS